MRSTVVSRIWKILPLMLFVMLFCNGCWDKKEFNQLAIAQTIAIDYQENQYTLTVQLVMPAASDVEISGDSMWLISGEGASVAEALEQISRSAPRELYLDHLDIVLLGEGVLQHDMGQGIEYLIQEDVLRRRTNLLAVKGTAKELLETKLKLADVDIYYLRNLLRDQRQWVQGGDTIINDYYLAMGNGLVEGLIIPRIEMKGENALYLNGAALLQKNKEEDKQENKEEDREEQKQDSKKERKKEEKQTGTLLRWVEQDWVDSYRWITGGAEILTLPANEEHGNLTVQVRKDRCKWELVSKEPLGVRANLHGTLLITENSTQRDTKTMTELETENRQIQQEVEQLLRERTEQDFTALQKQECDALRLGRWLRAWHPDLMEKDWPKQFASLTIDVQMKTKVRSDT